MFLPRPSTWTKTSKISLSKLFCYFQALNTLNLGQIAVFGELKSLEGFLSPKSLGSLPHHDLSQLDQKLSQMANALNVDSLVLESIKGNRKEDFMLVPWPFSSDEEKRSFRPLSMSSREKGKDFPDFSTIKVNIQGNSIGKTKSFLCHNRVYNNYYYKSSDEVLEAVEKIVAQVDFVERQKLAEWISPLDFSGQLSKYLEKIAHGTFQWFFEDTKYFSWRQGRTRELWCPGDFGVGKTLLASNVIEDLQRRFNTTANYAVLYLYFSHKETYTLRELVACLLRQLVYPRLTQSDLVKSLRADQQQNRPPCSQKVSDLLHSEIQTYQRVFIVTDALDEYPETLRKPFLDMLRNLPSNASLLVTSRHIPSTAAHFQTHVLIADDLGVLNPIEVLKVLKALQAPGPLDLQNKDLTSVIPLSPLGLGLESVPNLICPITSRNISKSGYSLANITAKIVEKANGMFLLATLHLDSLGNQTNALGFQRALEQLPMTLDTAYDAVIHNRIDSQSPLDRDLAYRVISWVFFAWRPLNLPELQHALATPTAAKEGLIELALVADEPDVILSSCAGLVVKDGGGHIRFRHHTIHEYFQRLYCRAPSSFIPPAQLVECCLEYNTKYSNSASDRLLWGGNCFSQYASDWYKHLPDDFEVLENLIPVVIRLMPLVRIRDDLQLIQELVNQGRLTTLHLAALSGLVSATKTAAVHSRCEHIADALVIALLAYQSKVAQWLASSASLNLNWQDPDGYTPLIAASMSGLYQVVKLLLARPGIEVNIQDKSGKTALIAACESKRATLASERADRAKIVELLLGVANIQVNHKNFSGCSALMIAAAAGSANVVRLLLSTRSEITASTIPQKGGHSVVDINARDQRGYTALMHGLQGRGGKGRFNCLRLLLQDPAIKATGRDGSQCTALMLAVLARPELRPLQWEDVIKRLLALKDVDINATDQDGHSALFFARYGAYRYGASMIDPTGSNCYWWGAMLRH
ncbi:hypothetical protein C8J56DRAFT_1167001 [Mycena floridula]|nr:hypothetical protein C8J56DRAFT_1167001 [Mycena floridula]